MFTVICCMAAGAVTVLPDDSVARDKHAEHVPPSSVLQPGLQVNQIKSLCNTKSRSCHGPVLRTWGSARDAGDALGIDPKKIELCLMGRVMGAGSYRWRYADDAAAPLLATEATSLDAVTAVLAEATSPADGAAASLLASEATSVPLDAVTAVPAEGAAASLLVTEATSGPVVAVTAVPAEGAAGAQQPAVLATDAATSVQRSNKQNSKLQMLMDQATAKARNGSFKGVCSESQLGGAVRRTADTTQDVALPRCVDDESACGSFVGGDHEATSWRMIGKAPGCAYAPLVDNVNNRPSGTEFARCAVTNERIVLVGDSTTRQLFGALACLIDGERNAVRARWRRPGGLPAKTEAGHPINWGRKKSLMPDDESRDVCELDPRLAGKEKVPYLRFTWALPELNATLSLRFAEDAKMWRDLVNQGTVWSLKTQNLAGTSTFTVLAANMGLHYPLGGTATLDHFSKETMHAFDGLRGHERFRGARVMWIETQVLPERNDRKFLENNVTAHPDGRRSRANEMARARGVPVVRTLPMLKQHYEYYSSDLHQAAATRYRAELLLNHIAKPSCFVNHSSVEVWAF